MREKIMETFNCENPLCGKEVTRPRQNRAIVGRRKKLCSRECGWAVMNHTIGKHY